VQELFSFFIAPLFGTVILGMLWKRATKAGGFWGLLSGTVAAITMWLAVRHDPANIRFMILQPHDSADTIVRVQAMAANIYRGLWSWVVCVIVTIVVSYMTKPVPEEQLVGLVYGATPIPHDGTTHIMQKPIFWAGVVAVVLVALNVWLW
jgi:SSS family solute:Na+ symporter